MTIKRKAALVAGTVIAALAVGGVAVAGAAGGDDADDQPITGTALERASQAALAHTGGGDITETEIEDEDAAYEVEVMRGDGNQVEVELDRDFNVLGSEADDERGDDDDERGEADDD